MILDPTRTRMLRQQYSRQLTKLYKNFGKHAIPLLTDAVINYRRKYGVMDDKHYLSQKTIKTMGVTDDVGNWLNFEVGREILTPSKDIIKRNIIHAYGKGHAKGQTQLDAYNIEVAGGMMPVDWEALTELQDINFNRITACTSAMQDAITYSCSRGVMEGWGMDKIAYELRRNVNGTQNMGIVRAKMIARTEVINAYVRASDNRYKEAGLSEKEIIVMAASDCCEICDAYDGKPVSNVGYPPFHPNCRCAIAPNPRKR